MSEELRNLFVAEKSLSGRLEWPGAIEGKLVLVCPLEVDGVTIQGLRLRVTAVEALPDEAVVLQLEYLGSRPKFEPMARFEWRPLSPHDNQGRGPPELQYRKIRGSHFHPFEPNYAESMRSTRRRNLPIAFPVSPEPTTFAEALEFAGKEFRISNMELVPAPLWQAKIL